MPKADLNRIKILKALHQHSELSGADIIKIDKTISKNSVYPVIRRMECAGLLSSRVEKIPGERNRPRRFYKITDQGLATLAFTTSLDIAKKVPPQWLKDLVTEKSNWYDDKALFRKKTIICFLEAYISKLKTVNHVEFAYDFYARFNKLHEEFQISPVLGQILNEDKIVIEPKSINWPEALYDIPDTYRAPIIYKYVYTYFADNNDLIDLIVFPASIGEIPKEPPADIPLMNEDYIDTINRYVDHITSLNPPQHSIIRVIDDTVAKLLVTDKIEIEGKPVTEYVEAKEPKYGYLPKKVVKFYEARPPHQIIPNSIDTLPKKLRKLINNIIKHHNKYADHLEDETTAMPASSNPDQSTTKPHLKN